MKNLCNCIVLYDYDPADVDLKEWFTYMEQWAEKIKQPWESAGVGDSTRLLQFENAKKRLKKNSFIDCFGITLIGGVKKPGTNDDWKTYAHISVKKEEPARTESFLCFSSALLPFSKNILSGFIQSFLKFSNFKYGICYQREYIKGPDSYASGVIEAYGNTEILDYEENQISAWMKKYYTRPHYYRTGLLRDVYPFNIFVKTHLNEKVGSQTFEEWITSDPRHGVLEKITDNHWLWSIDPENIPAAQETLQEAGLLLCYKP